jgi:hypothetical protein
VLILRDMEGREADEACTLLGISAENQRVLLHRARGRIRQSIDRLIGDAAPVPAQIAQRSRPGRRPPSARAFLAAVMRLCGIGRRAVAAG